MKFVIKCKNITGKLFLTPFQSLKNYVGALSHQLRLQNVDSLDELSPSLSRSATLLERKEASHESSALRDRERLGWVVHLKCTCTAGLVYGKANIIQLSFAFRFFLYS